MGARSNQVYRRLRARALRHKTPSFAALFTAPAQPTLLTGRHHQRRKRSAFDRAASAARFPAERVGWVPGAIRCIGGFAPAHSGTKRLRLRLCSRRPRSRHCPAGTISAASAAAFDRAASAALSSGARRMGARSNQVYRRLRARALRHKTPSFAALFTAPAQPTLLTGRHHQRRKRSAFDRAASAALSSGARRMGARSNQVYRRLRARALRHKTPSFAALFTAPAQPNIADRPAPSAPQAQRLLTEPQAQLRFPAERVGWVPGAIRCIGGFAPAHSGTKRLRLRLCPRRPRSRHC
jgi:hypothetical protein